MKQFGYWSKVFKQAIELMKQNPKIDGESAFWLARGIVDKSLDSLPFHEEKIFHNGGSIHLVPLGGLK